MFSLLGLCKFLDLFMGLRKEAPEMFDGALAAEAVGTVLDHEASATTTRQRI